MKTFRKADQFQNYLRQFVQKKSIGFVPTMGDMHAGHLSLIHRSKRENDVTVVSVFVNPAQFDRKEDYAKYHRSLKTDLAKMKKEKVDLVLAPSAYELYPENFQTWVNVENLSKPLCGAFRPGHFRGVTTIVLKLLNLVQPHRVYMGMKDFQQYKLIERMVQDLNLPIQVVPCPIVREGDGLAMSSRNRRLSIKERTRAAQIFRALQSVGDLIKSQNKVARSQIFNHFKKNLALAPADKLEYFEIVHPDTLLSAKNNRLPLLIATAVWIGKTRLIDNMLLH